MSDNEKVFDDEYVESIASDLLGHNLYSKDMARKAKNRAKYQIKKNPALKTLVMETIKAWEEDRQESLGGTDVHRIMNENFPNG